MKINKNYIIAVIFWITLWQIGSFFFASEILLPSPVSVLLCLFNLVLTGEFWQAIGLSYARIIGGFILAWAVGLCLVWLSYKFTIIENLLAPIISVIKSVPVASFVILALVWLNSKSLTIFIVFLMVFPVVYQNILSGIKHLDAELMDVTKLYGAREGEIVKSVYFPLLLPHIKTALSLGIGLCFKAGVAAEVIGIPKGSVGERLYSAKIYLKTPELFAYTLAIVIISIMTEKAIIWLINNICNDTSNGSR